MGGRMNVGKDRMADGPRLLSSPPYFVAERRGATSHPTIASHKYLSTGHVVHLDGTPVFGIVVCCCGFVAVDYNDFIMGWLRLKSPASRLFTQPFIQDEIKDNIKAPRHWPLCGDFTGSGEFPAQMASNAENVSIWWRQHVIWPMPIDGCFTDNVAIIFCPKRSDSRIW